MSICKNLATSSYEGFIPSLTSVITLFKAPSSSLTLFSIFFAIKTRISLDIGTRFSIAISCRIANLVSYSGGCISHTIPPSNLVLSLSVIFLISLGALSEASTICLLA